MAGDMNSRMPGSDRWAAERTYNCSHCNRPYSPYINQNYIYGRVPYLMPCTHTICEECYSKMARNKKVLCKECQCELTTDQPTNTCQQLFPVDLYKFGFLMQDQIKVHRPNPGQQQSINRYMQPAGARVKNARPPPTIPANLLKNPVKKPQRDVIVTRCAYSDCNDEATWMCTSCKEAFCARCDQIFHSAVKILRNHTRHLIDMNTFNDFHLNCQEHPEKTAEYSCESCSMILCSACIIQNHAGHSILSLEDLNKTKLPEFEAVRKRAVHVLRRMKSTQLKVKDRLLTTSRPSANLGSSVESEIINHFAQLHSQLQLIEHETLNNYSKALNSRTESLLRISNELEANIKSLQPLINTAKVAVEENLGKVDLCQLNQEITKNLELPCELIENDAVADNKIQFVVDDDFVTVLERHCRLISNADGAFSLMPITEYPVDIDTELSTSDTEIESIRSVNSSMNSSIKSASTVSNHKSEKTYGKMSRNVVSLENRSPSIEFNYDSATERHDFKKSDDPIVLTSGTVEGVSVTHIVNPLLFYVQIYRKNKEFENLLFRCDNYAKSTKAPEKVENNSNYIVKFMPYKNNTTQWYRAQLISIDETQDKPYEMFFFDFGNTDRVTLNDIRTMKPVLMKNPPYAYRCRLYGIVPPTEQWSDEILHYMIKYITGLETPPLCLADLSLILKTELSTRCLKMRVIKNNKGILDVDLSSGHDSLRDAMIFVGYAIATSNISSLPSVSTPAFNTQTRIMPSIYNYQKNKVYDVYVTNIVTPSCLYIQKADVKADIVKLEDTITRIALKDQKLIYVPQKGMYCAALDNKTKKWRRCEIINTKTDGEVQVFFMDYGIQQTVQWKNLRILKESFKQTDAQAVKVTLSDIIPRSGDKWSTPAIEYLRNVTESKVLRALVNESAKEDELEITLFESMPEMDLCINSDLVKRQFAESIGPNSLLVEFHKIHATDDQRVGQKLFEEHLKNNVVTYPENINKGCSSAASPFNIAVDILHIESPSCFYVCPKKWIDERAKLQRKLNSFYKDKTPALMKQWQLDEFCVVRSSNQHFHRGQIKTVLDHNKYTVILIDYGRSELLINEKIYTIDDSFKERVLAMKCSLSGLKPPGGGQDIWPRIAVEYFEDIVAKSKQQLFITKHGTFSDKKVIPVSLFRIWEEEHGPLEPLKMHKTVLNQLLLDEGLALPVKLDPLPVETQNADKEESYDSQSSWTDLETEETIGNIYNPVPQTPTITKWLPPFRFKDKKFKAIVSYVDENGFVYISDLRSRNILTNINRILNSKYLQSVPDPADQTWTEGQLCIVQYHLDMSFNRGLIQNITPDGTIQVQLVDYGNVEDCNHSELRSALILTDIPILTVKCSLSNVFPKTSDGKWPIPVLDTLHHTIVDKECDITIENDPATAETPSITIILDGKTINYDLMQWDWSRTDEMVKTVDVIKDDSDESVIIEGEVEPDLPDISDILENAKNYPTSTPRDSINLDDGQKPLKYNKLKLPDGEESFEATIINVIDYRTCIIETSFANDSIKETTDVFDALLTEINDFAPEQAQLQDFRINTPCLAQFSEDLRWYRTEIYEIYDAQHVKVMFVDYGNIEIVPNTNVRSIKPEWLEYPVQQIKCKIYDLTKSKDLSDLKAAELMSVALLNNTYICQVVTTVPELEVKFIHTETYDLAYKQLIDDSMFFTSK